jgi:enoyl-CoA hydratase/carnithine racemase
MTERVQVEIEPDGLAVVTLNRPDKLNALDRATFEELHAAARHLSEGAASGDVRAVLLRGAGRGFCSGLDVSLFGEQAAGDAALGAGPDPIAYLQQAFTGFEDLPVPTVAALHGAVLGGGLQLAMACHLRVARADATLGLLEVRWAIIPDLGASYRLPRLVGLSRATDLAVSGRTIDATTAHAWGLVDELVGPQASDDEWAERGHAYAQRLAAGPTTATGAIPRLMRTGMVADRDAALAAERAAQVRCLSSDDFREAVTAAMEGRKPSFGGT